MESVDVILPPSIQIGSDEKKSLIKAIDTVFPDAKRSLCTKHLKDNVSVYIRNKIGVKTKERVHIMDSIFGEEGVLNSKDTFEFEERCATITTLPGASSQEFFNYFQNILQPKLKLNFSNLEPSGLNSASKWTNNNAESIHNLMKINVN
jgi:transposase-like protein